MDVAAAPSGVCLQVEAPPSPDSAGMRLCGSVVGTTLDIQPGDHTRRWRALKCMFWMKKFQADRKKHQKTLLLPLPTPGTRSTVSFPLPPKSPTTFQTEIDTPSHPQHSRHLISSIKICCRNAIHPLKHAKCFDWSLQ